MTKYSKLKRKWLFLMLFLLIIPSVCAYLDPGTGSMLLQILIGGVATALFSIKIYWKKIKSKLTKFFLGEDSNLEDKE